MPKKFRGVSLPEEIVDTIEDFIENNPRYGYRSIADFVIDAVRKRLEDLGATPPVISLMHLNINPDRSVVLLWDNKEKRAIDILVTEDEVRCLYCDSIRCEHVKFAVNLPQVQKEFNRRRKLGLKIPDLSHLDLEV